MSPEAAWNWMRPQHDWINGASVEAKIGQPREFVMDTLVVTARSSV